MRKFFLIILICMLLPSGALASFACGKVNSYDGFSSVGFDVKVSYDENPFQYTLCKVTSSELKFCCDLEAIKGAQWAAGKEVSAEIFNSDFGFVAGPVHLTISGNGYDVFPEMSLQKVLNVSPSIESIYLNTKEIVINISTLASYNNINYSITSSNANYENQLCTDCNFAVLNLSNLSEGNYQLRIKAYGDEAMEQAFNFTILKFLNFERNFSCNGCKKNFIPNNRIVNMTITINASDPVSGTLQDFIPNNWECISGCDTFNDAYNYVSWNVDGSYFSGSYLIRSPSSPLPKFYSFQSEFEGVYSQKSRIKVFYFNVPYFSISNNGNVKLLKANYSITSPSIPLILKLNKQPIDLIAIFPNKEVKKATANIVFNKNQFTIISNIPASQIGSILVRIQNTKKNVSISDMSNNHIIAANDSIVDSGNTFYDFYLKKKGDYKILT